MSATVLTHWFLYSVSELSENGEIFYRQLNIRKDRSSKSYLVEKGKLSSTNSLSVDEYAIEF